MNTTASITNSVLHYTSLHSTVPLYTDHIFPLKLKATLHDEITFLTLLTSLMKLMSDLDTVCLYYLFLQATAFIVTQTNCS